MTTYSASRSPRRPMTPLMWVLLVAFLSLALVTACLTFFVAREYIATRLGSAAVQGPDLATVAAAAGTPGLTSQTPLQPLAGPTPRPWDGAERINILFVGLDYRDWEGGGPARSDTMILFTLDPSTHTAGMISLPRDLWVNIPGFDYGKLNTAYYLGELYQLEGGGPGLAARTVELFLGVDVHYYAQVDFNSFIQFIDLLEGIDVEVPEEISIDPLGPKNTTTLSAGLQHLDGELALAYARNRDTIGSDFDRAQRQQQVIMAVRDRILNLDLMPQLVEKSPQIYMQLSSGLRTNLNLETLVQLAWLASQVPAEGIRRGAIGPNEVTMSVSPEGLDILLPDPDAVRAVRDDIFAVGEAYQPQLSHAALLELVLEEAASISVLNATSTPGLAAATSDFLRDKQLAVTNTGNAQQAASQTSIILYTSKPYTIQYLVNTMQLDQSHVYSRYDPNSTVDIVILLGSDWVQDNPMP